MVVSGPLTTQQKHEVHSAFVGFISDLHEHTEASLQQVRQSSRHVLNVWTFDSVRMEDLLQDLTQERTIGRLQKITRQKRTKA